MIDAGHPLAWMAVAAAGAAVGRILTVAARPLLAVDPDGRPARTDRRVANGVEIAAVLGALASWWWEVVPAATAAVPPAIAPVTPLVARWASHLVLFAFLAAAAWVDLRHRVIPDAITVPGVLAGLAWCGLAPSLLLPITVEVPRSFADPLLEPDVLGPVGGLSLAAWPAWLGSWPAWTGLAAALAVFGGWWRGCTAPFRDPGSRRTGGMVVLGEPRNLVLVAGVLGITAAWCAGGLGWRGLLTGLVGLAAGAGMVWLVRIGASRALGREAMGFGDVTLMAMTGAWLGWQASVLVCFLGVLIGAVHGVLRLSWHRGSELPFGPSLCLAAVLVVTGWRPLWEASEFAFEQPQDMAAVVMVVIVLTAVSLAIWRRFRPEAAA